MASPALALRQLWQELVAEYGDRIEYLGIMGDARHCPGPSDHCPGNALDIGIKGDIALGNEIRDRLLSDRRCWYTIFQALGKRALWRGGGTFDSVGHMGHIHLSITAGGRNDTTPWGFGGTSAPIPEPELKEIIMSAVTSAASAVAVAYHNPRYDRDEYHRFRIDSGGILRQVFYADGAKDPFNGNNLGSGYEPDGDVWALVWKAGSDQEELHVGGRLANGSDNHWVYNPAANKWIEQPLDKYEG